MTFLDPSLCPPGAQTATTGPPFSPKRPPKVQSPSRPGPAVSRPGRDQRPKTPKVTFSSIQGSIWEWFRARFWSILGSISKQIELPSMKSHWYSKNLLVEVFPRSFFIFHANSWYSIQAYWYFIKGELSRKVSRYSTKAFWHSASPTHSISPNYPMYPTCATFPTYPTYPT